jgi:putative transposase
MPFWRTFYHLVWATKKREPLISPDVEPQLYGYLQAKARELGVEVFAIGGWTDHIHLVVSIPPRLSVAEVVKALKGASAFHLNHGAALAGHFAWQRGYGVLTVGEKQRPAAEAYVQRQKEHHRSGSTNSWLERLDEADDGPAAAGQHLSPEIIGYESIVTGGPEATTTE